jgi:hypothetical protein
MGLTTIPGPQFRPTSKPFEPAAMKTVAKGLIVLLPLLFLGTLQAMAQSGSQASTPPGSAPAVSKTSAKSRSTAPKANPGSQGSALSVQAPTPSSPKDSVQSDSTSTSTPPPQASAQGSSQSPTPPAQGTSTQSPSQEATPAPGAPLENDPTAAASTPRPASAIPSVLPAATRPMHRPFASTHGALPAANVPALEARLGFSTLSRVSSPNNRVLYRGFTGSVTKQYTDRLGGTIEVGYLRASNVFQTGQSNSVLTYLIGPVFYPWRPDGFVISARALGGGGRVAGVIALTSTPGQYLKGTVDDRAWALGSGVEKWFFSDSIALRVNIDALHTTFFNSVAKVHGEYDLRATWGVSYYFGLKRREGKLSNVAGRPIE